MSVANVPDRYGECADCDSPKGNLICQACADEQAGDVVEKARGLLVRYKTIGGLTDAEVSIVERMISDLESS